MTSLGRIMGFNKPRVKVFCDLLKTEMDKHHFMSSRIYNADETGVPTKVPKVLLPKELNVLQKLPALNVENSDYYVLCERLRKFCAACFYFPESSYASAEFLDDAPRNLVV